MGYKTKQKRRKISMKKNTIEQLLDEEEKTDGRDHQYRTLVRITMLTFDAFLMLPLPALLLCLADFKKGVEIRTDRVANCL